MAARRAAIPGLQMGPGGRPVCLYVLYREDDCRSEA